MNYELKNNRYGAKDATHTERIWNAENAEQRNIAEHYASDSRNTLTDTERI